MLPVDLNTPLTLCFRNKTQKNPRLSRELQVTFEEGQGEAQEMTELGVQHFLQKSHNTGNTDNPANQSAYPVCPENQQPVIQLEKPAKELRISCDTW